MGTWVWVSHGFKIRDPYLYSLYTHRLYPVGFYTHVNPYLAFSTFPFNKNVQSWVIMNISGDAVTKDKEATRVALGTIKTRFWYNPKFWALADRSLATQGIGKLNVERAWIVTQSYHLRFIETKDSQGNDAPVWQLTRKPITSDTKKHREYLSIIQNDHYLVRLHFLEVEKRFVDCAGCKSDTHLAHMCPFPKIEDWMGPIPDNASSSTWKEVPIRKRETHLLIVGKMVGLEREA